MSLTNSPRQTLGDPSSRLWGQRLGFRGCDGRIGARRGFRGFRLWRRLGLGLRRSLVSGCPACARTDTNLRGHRWRLPHCIIRRPPLSIDTRFPLQVRGGRRLFERLAILGVAGLDEAMPLMTGVSTHPIHRESSRQQTLRASLRENFLSQVGQGKGFAAM